jgi:hypothetical protein
MMKKLLSVPVFVVLLCLSSHASAGMFFFGTQDTIQHVANTTLTGPNGSRLYLGQRVTMKAFFLPYTIKSNGYVFGISGEPTKYIPLPTGADLEALQKNGFLPKPLPPLKMGWFEYLMGYALWWALLFIVVLPWLKKRLLTNRK